MLNTDSHPLCSTSVCGWSGSSVHEDLGAAAPQSARWVQDLQRDQRGPSCHQKHPPPTKSDSRHIKELYFDITSGMRNVCIITFNLGGTGLIKTKTFYNDLVQQIEKLLRIFGFVECVDFTKAPGSVAAGLTESISPATSWISLASMARSLARSWLILMNKYKSSMIRMQDIFLPVFL